MPVELVTPDEVVDHLIAVLTGPPPLGRLEEHFAKLERKRGLPPMTLGRVWRNGTAPPAGVTGDRLFTVDYLAGDGFRERTDKPPIALIGLAGDLAEPAKRNAIPRLPDRAPGMDGMALGMTWTVGVEVSVVGEGRADTIRRTAWFGYTVVECLLQHTETRGDPLTGFALLDGDLQSGAAAETASTLGQARFTFEAQVLNALPLTPEFRTRPDDPYAAPGSTLVDPPLHGRHTVVKVPIPEDVR